MIIENLIINYNIEIGIFSLNFNLFVLEINLRI